MKWNLAALLILLLWSSDSSALVFDAKFTVLEAQTGDSTFSILSLTNDAERPVENVEVLLANVGEHSNSPGFFPITLTHECPAVLSPGESCDVTVRFDPKTQWTFWALLVAAAKNTPSAFVGLEGRTRPRTTLPEGGIILSYRDWQNRPIQVDPRLNGYFLVINLASAPQRFKKLKLHNGKKGLRLHNVTCGREIAAASACVLRIEASMPTGAYPNSVYDHLIIQMKSYRLIYGVGGHCEMNEYYTCR